MAIATKVNRAGSTKKAIVDFLDSNLFTLALLIIENAGPPTDGRPRINPKLIS